MFHVSEDMKNPGAAEPSEKWGGSGGVLFFRATFYCIFGRFGKVIQFLNLKKWGVQLFKQVPAVKLKIRLDFFWSLICLFTPLGWNWKSVKVFIIKTKWGLDTLLLQHYGMFVHLSSNVLASYSKDLTSI